MKTDKFYKVETSVEFESGDVNITLTSSSIYFCAHIYTGAERMSNEFLKAVKSALKVSDRVRLRMATVDLVECDQIGYTPKMVNSWRIVRNYDGNKIAKFNAVKQCYNFDEVDPSDITVEQFLKRFVNELNAEAFRRYVETLAA